MADEYHIIKRKLKLKLCNKEDWSRINQLFFLNSCAANYTISGLYMRSRLQKMLVYSKYLPSELKNKDKDDVNRIWKDSKNEVDSFLSSDVKNFTYRDIVNKFPDLPGSIAVGVQRKVEKIYGNCYSDINNGVASLPTFKKNFPLHFGKNRLIFKEDSNKNLYIKYCNKINFRIILGKDRSNNRSIIDKVITNEYEGCDSTLHIEDKTLYLLLAVKVPKKKSYLDKDVTVGVDLGLSNIAVMSVNSGLSRKFIGNSLLDRRVRLKNQRNKIYKEIKFIKGGKGKNKKLKRLKTISKSERNFVRTESHRIAKTIVQFSIKHNAYKINLEDLCNIKNIKDTFIHNNWNYYELQTLIEEKANKYGIQVEKVNPAYTSQVCNKCKCKGDRIDQKTFICKNNKCDIDKINADYNAAKNIANGGVGLTYNKETKLYFESLDYGAVVCPEAEGISTR